MTDTFTLTFPAEKIAVVHRVFQQHFDHVKKQCTGAQDQYDKSKDENLLSVIEFYKEELKVFTGLINQIEKA